MKMQCWDEAMSICYKISTSVITDTVMERFSALCTVLSDDLAMKVEQHASDGLSSSLLLHLHTELAKYRSSLLLEMQTHIADYKRISQIINTASHALQPTMLNLFDVLKQLNACVKGINNELRSYTQGVSCHIAPLQLRCSDLFHLFTPDLTGPTSEVVQHQLQLEATIRNPTFSHLPSSFSTMNQVQPTSYGLSSFTVPINSSKLPIFEQKEVHFIGNVVKQLSTALLGHVESTFLDQESLVHSLSSANEVIPLQIALALSVMSIARASTIHLRNSSLFGHIVVPPLGHNVDILNSEIHSLQSSVEQLRVQLSTAQNLEKESYFAIQYKSDSLAATRVKLQAKIEQKELEIKYKTQDLASAKKKLAEEVYPIFLLFNNFFYFYFSFFFLLLFIIFIFLYFTLFYLTFKAITTETKQVQSCLNLLQC